MALAGDAPLWHLFQLYIWRPGAAAAMAIRQPPSRGADSKLRAVLLEQRLSPPPSVRWSSWRLRHMFVNFDLSLWKLPVFPASATRGQSVLVCVCETQPFNCSAVFPSVCGLKGADVSSSSDFASLLLAVGVAAFKSALASTLTRGQPLLIFFFCGVFRPSRGGLS